MKYLYFVLLVIVSGRVMAQDTTQPQNLAEHLSSIYEQLHVIADWGAPHCEDHHEDKDEVRICDIANRFQVFEDEFIGSEKKFHKKLNEYKIEETVRVREVFSHRKALLEKLFLEYELCTAYLKSHQPYPYADMSVFEEEIDILNDVEHDVLYGLEEHEKRTIEFIEEFDQDIEHTVGDTTLIHFSNLFYSLKSSFYATKNQEKVKNFEKEYDRLQQRMQLLNADKIVFDTKHSSKTVNIRNRETKKWGVYQFLSDTIIPIVNPRFTKAKAYVEIQNCFTSDNRVVKYKGGTFQFFTPEGKEATPVLTLPKGEKEWTLYEITRTFNVQDFIAITDDKYGMTDTDGTIIIPFVYDELVHNSSTGEYAVKKDNKWFLYKKENPVPIEVTSILGTERNYFIYQNLDEIGFLSKDNKKIKSITGQAFGGTGKTTQIKIFNNQGEGLINSDGKMLLQPKYEEVHLFQFGLACVKMNGKYGFVDEQEKLVIDYQFDTNSWFYEENRAEVSKSHDCFIIDRTGKKLESISCAW